MKTPQAYTEPSFSLLCECLVHFLCHNLSILICTPLISSLPLKLSRKANWVIYYQLRTELTGRQATWESGRQHWKPVGVLFSYQLNNSNTFEFTVTIKMKSKYNLNRSFIQTTLCALAGPPLSLQTGPRRQSPVLRGTWQCAAHGSIAAPWLPPSARSGTSSSAASPGHASGWGCMPASACLSAASPGKQPALLWKISLSSQTDTGYDPEKRK